MSSKKKQNWKYVLPRILQGIIDLFLFFDISNNTQNLLLLATLYLYSYVPWYWVKRTFIILRFVRLWRRVTLKYFFKYRLPSMYEKTKQGIRNDLYWGSIFSSTLYQKYITHLGLDVWDATEIFTTRLFKYTRRSRKLEQK